MLFFSAVETFTKFPRDFGSLKAKNGSKKTLLACHVKIVCWVLSCMTENCQDELRKLETVNSLPLWASKVYVHVRTDFWLPTSGTQGYRLCRL